MVYWTSDGLLCVRCIVDIINEYPAFDETLLLYPPQNMISLRVSQNITEILYISDETNARFISFCERYGKDRLAIKYNSSVALHVMSVMTLDIIIRVIKNHISSMTNQDNYSNSILASFCSSSIEKAHIILSSIKLILRYRANFPSLLIEADLISDTIFKEEPELISVLKGRLCDDISTQITSNGLRNKRTLMYKTYIKVAISSLLMMNKYWSSDKISDNNVVSFLSFKDISDIREKLSFNFILLLLGANYLI